jgi:pimeloyl-ACP methyl ester carboxylesterase
MNKTIIHRSLTLSYRVEGVEGTGLPVLLIHGFAEDGAIWDGQVEYLKQRYRLIIPDLPGSGQSSPLSGPTTLEELADLIKALLDAEGIAQCILIGHSMGGYLTLAFAEKYPDRLKALGLFHSIAFADSDEKKTGRQKSIEFIRKNGSPAYIRQSAPNLFAGSSRQEHPELITSLIDRYAAFPPDTLVYYQQAMISRPDRAHILQQFPGPVLFIIGEQDAVIPLESSLRQTHIPALSHIHLLENSGHMGMIENSAASNPILDDFFAFLST